MQKFAVRLDSVMNERNERVIGITESICPVCLDRIPARRIAVDEDVYLDKTCRDHGNFKTIIWRGRPSYESWSVPKLPSRPPVCATNVERGCPFDCGLCPAHRQHTCCVLLEITQRCDLNCPVCFARAGGDSHDPDIRTIESWYRLLMESGGPYNIQLSGGEPTLRDDIPQIILLGRSLGYSFFQLNTNGLRLAKDNGYARSLKEAGLNCVFLQFDGTNDEIYRKIRGDGLMRVKESAILNCGKHNLGVVLVPTLLPGVNTDDIGKIIEFAVRMMPTVRGVHFQPVSYFGRYDSEPTDSGRITVPEVITKIERQTGGRLKVKDFHPPSAENAYCSFSGNFVLMPDGELKTWRKEGNSCCCSPQVAADGAKKSQCFVARKWSASEDNEVVNKIDCRRFMKVDSLDAFLERVEKFSLCVSGMAFQDAWNIDLERLRECFIHVVSPDNRIIPFCAFNLTGADGKSLYRSQSAYL
jgi:7,8-dihydro-6-hydroxymethylpterin dimethyltransferase